MQTALQLYREPAPAGRKLERIPVQLGATIRDAARRPVDALIHDISRMGFMAETPERLAVGTIVRIGLSGIGETVARVVWAEDRRHGCAFIDALSAQQIDAALTTDTVRLLESRPRSGLYVGRYRPETLARRRPALAAGIVSVAAMASIVATAGGAAWLWS